jgi:hypothetical protein
MELTREDKGYVGPATSLAATGENGITIATFGENGSVDLSGAVPYGSDMPGAVPYAPARAAFKLPAGMTGSCIAPVITALKLDGAIAASLAPSIAASSFAHVIAAWKGRSISIAASLNRKGGGSIASGGNGFNLGAGTGAGGVTGGGGLQHHHIPKQSTHSAINAKRSAKRETSVSISKIPRTLVTYRR